MSMNNNQIIREEIFDSIGGLTDQQINKRVEEGGWTIAQVLLHLFLLERVVTKAFTEQLRSEIKWVVEDKPIQYTTDRRKKIKAPSYLEPSSKFITLSDVKEKLAQSRRDFTEVVRGADESLLNERAIPHPVFGSLNLNQWISFIGLHEKRHLKQIEEIKEKLYQ
ncbi:DinB family protein [Bacillus massilinigeriensis]|uniref:DinB family protein n=1 Tax=Bacillus massilionigeriensis TaxID=1805475 RepID=UPI000A02C6DF|nr:DinB family protein [Bacillus massilionigeriensis]